MSQAGTPVGCSSTVNSGALLHCAAGCSAHEVLHLVPVPFALQVARTC